MKITLKSTRIKTVDFNEAKGIITIEFHKGGSYEYWPITNETYKELVNSNSPGNYFEQNIKKNPKISVFKLNDKS